MNPMNHFCKLCVLFLLLVFTMGCNRVGSESTLIASLISSDFPPDMDVPIIAGSTLLQGQVGFVAQDSPLAVLPFDTGTQGLSQTFSSTDLSFLRPSGGSIYGSDLFISTEYLGALCYSGSDSSGTHFTGVALFDPSTGAFLVDINCRFSVGTSYQTMDYNSGTDTVSYRSVPNFLTSFASGVVILGNSLYVSTSNLDPSNYSTYYPGTVLVFDISNINNPVLISTIFTGQDGLSSSIRYYNPTQVTLYGNQVLLVNTGATEFDSSFQSIVKTNGALEVIDSSTDTIVGSFDLGLSGLSGEEVKIYNDGVDDIAVMGSQVYGRLYRVNLSNPLVINDSTNPIVINAHTTNEITSCAVSTDGLTFFVASQKDDTIYVIDVASANATPATPTVLKQDDPSPSSSLKAFPSNMEILPFQGGSERVVFTNGQPPEIRLVTNP